MKPAKVRQLAKSLFGAILLGCSGLPVTAQEAPTTAPAQASSHSHPESVFQITLLRESSQILEAQATIEHDDQRNIWRAILDSSDPKQPQRKITLLPCTRLTDIQRQLASSPKSRFRLSGEVFVFRGQNYLLPTHASIIEGIEVSDQELQPTTKPSNVRADGSREEPSKSGDTAQSLLHELDSAAKGRSRPRGSIVTPESTGAAPPVRPNKLMREGTAITNRRGKISRDGSGAWLFVFDADAKGQSDPPLRLLPCMLLERIEDNVRRQGNNSPALLNGTVYVYEGQNYLVPTVFRIPQERRNLAP